MPRAKRDSDNDASKSWFCTFNNPEEHGYPGTPAETVSDVSADLEHPVAVTDLVDREAGAWGPRLTGGWGGHVNMAFERLYIRFMAP